MSKLSDFFSFSKGEKRGVAVLLIIILILIISTPFIEYFIINQQTDFSAFEEAINEFEKNRTNTVKKNTNFTSKEKTSLVIYPFDFNPNTISDSAWKKLGFADWQIKIINNYKSNGGKWRTKYDVRKIYGLNDSIFEFLKPYILLPDSINNKGQNSQTNTKTNFSNSYTPKEKKELIIDINKADTTEFKKLKGIGSGYSKRIIKYRDLLGGFSSVEQIKEVYGIKEDLYNSIKPYLTISLENKINKININTCDAVELKNHPYINWNIANSIVNYRKSHGNFNKVNDIKKIHLITEEIYPKIAPYLKTK